jgi:hypothetical protein
MGRGVAIACGHALLADMSPFGQDKSNHILIPIDESHGSIEAAVKRQSLPWYK